MKTLNTICQIAAFVLVLPIGLVCLVLRKFNVNVEGVVKALTAFVEGATAKNTGLVIVLSIITVPVLFVQGVVAGAKVWKQNMYAR